ncbi:MAG: glycerophosphodiester phosphodiesterase [Actinobacteria bacterium]|jgi:glycerophosphoryl diester phosphodiesterase|nr:glycerophosphodiester phosphodiesterase [Actinomycetota bacterium]MBT3745840.1 glycerophosphodiester phosphodiesterase [Actinomycetota bacterium]MBT3969282.1 glycerophosphodiester phosphodiesterase [Actinomycetota bacterium]MBT4009484.1 glycerophosphodiester phosphodiesterase [Actinomycetota bacterium]MBT4302381.1 glycerophosphodiester phosphodiesterase [Actinomycetota bacterium]
MTDTSLNAPSRRPLVIAHRGASVDHLENTVEAFAGARQQGADWVELDVRRSADGVLVVHHDAHLTDGQLIRDLTAEELPEHIPSLAEAFETVDGLGVNIEIKSLPGEPDHEDMAMVCEAVVGLATAYRPPELVRVSSFNIRAVDHIRETDPNLPTGWLTVERIGSHLILDRTVDHGHGAIHPWDELVDESLVDGAHNRGLKVLVWTVDDEERIAELASWGVDGIITNLPGVARRVLDALA